MTAAGWYEHMRGGAEEECQPQFPQHVIIMRRESKPIDPVVPYRLAPERESPWTGKNPFSLPGEPA